MNKQEKVKLKERRKGINEDSLKRKKEKNQTDNVHCKLLMKLLNYRIEGLFAHFM